VSPLPTRTSPHSPPLARGSLHSTRTPPASPLVAGLRAPQLIVRLLIRESGAQRRCAPYFVVNCATMKSAWLWLAVLGLAPLASAGDNPNIEVLLEAPLPPMTGQVPAAAPPRFVLLEDGRVFVGGTSDVLEGRLSGGPLKSLRSDVARLRKLKGLADRLRFGPGDEEYRLRLGKVREIVATGDIQRAPFDARPAAALIEKLLHFDDPSLHLYRPERYELSVRPGALVGGCRSWSLPVPIVDALAGPRFVPASAVTSWPTGALAASVCAGDKTFIVTLRPLLTWEHR